MIKKHGVAPTQKARKRIISEFALEMKDFYVNDQQKIIGILSKRYPSVEAMQVEEPNLVGENCWNYIKVLISTNCTNLSKIAYLVTDKEGLDMKEPAFILWCNVNGATLVRKGYVCKEWEEYESKFFVDGIPLACPIEEHLDFVKQLKNKLK
jgi:hypothetical protein